MLYVFSFGGNPRPGDPIWYGLPISSTDLWAISLLNMDDGCPLLQETRAIFEAGSLWRCSRKYKRRVAHFKSTQISCWTIPFYSLGQPRPLTLPCVRAPTWHLFFFYFLAFWRFTCEVIFDSPLTNGHWTNLAFCMHALFTERIGSCPSIDDHSLGNGCWLVGLSILSAICGINWDYYSQRRIIFRGVETTKQPFHGLSG